MDALRTFVTKPVPLWAAVSGAVGVGVVVYFVTEKLMISEVEEMTKHVEKELDAVKALYSPNDVQEVYEDEFEVPTTSPLKDTDGLVTYNRTEEIDVVDEVLATDPNAPIEEIYVPPGNPKGRFDYRVEKPMRTEDAPYIITEEEYIAEERGYGHESLTFYADDAILCDDQDIPIDDPTNLVGPDALQSFGYGANNTDTVFVRNPRLHTEYEIEIEGGGYGETVAGFVPEE